MDWQVIGGEKLFTNYNAFSFPFLFCFLFSSLKHKEQAVKGKKKHLVHRGGKRFLLLCKEKAITDFVDKCVTSAGVSRPF